MEEYWKGSSRPPRPCHSSLLSWEKIFCTSVCRVPWEKICAAKFAMPGYKNIAKWDDSGALEAFENAKARYWAEISGLPCDIPLPGPDIFIDEVDHNPWIDPELVADLYKKPPPPPRQNDKYEDLSYEAFLNATLPVKATGWGDAEEDRTDPLIEKPLPATGWGNDTEEHLPANGSSGTSWNENGGWGNGAVCDTAKGSSGTSWNENGRWGGGWGDGAVCDSSWSKQRKYASWGKQSDNWNDRGKKNGRNRNGYSSRFSNSPGVMGQWKPKPPCRPMNGQTSAEGTWR